MPKPMPLVEPVTSAVFPCSMWISRGRVDSRHSRRCVEVAWIVRRCRANLRRRIAFASAVSSARFDRPSRRRAAKSLSAGGRNDMQTIAIVGGGFAGTTLMRALDGRLPADHELLLVSEESYTTFNSMLAEAVGASVFPEQVVAPIRQMIRSARFVMGRVTAVDPMRRTLRCETLAGMLDQRFEHLVLAFGNRARLDLLPRLAENWLGLKNTGDRYPR